MGGTAGTGNNHAQPALASLLGEGDHLQRCAVSRKHTNFHCNPQLLQHLYGRMEAGEIGIAAHDDGDPGCGTWIIGGGWQHGHRQEPEGRRDCHRPAPA